MPSIRIRVPGMARYRVDQYWAELSGNRTLTVSASKRVAVRSQVWSTPSACATAGTTSKAVDTAASSALVAMSHRFGRMATDLPLDDTRAGVDSPHGQATQTRATTFD